MPLVVGRVVEPPELLVAELLVKTWRLKAERVEPGGVTAALSRAGFDLSHQLASNPMAAQFIGDPKVFDEKPAAISLTYETGNDLSAVSDKNPERVPGRVARPLLLIESFQPVRKELDICIGGFVFDRQPISGPQPEERTTAHRTSISRARLPGQHRLAMEADRVVRV